METQIIISKPMWWTGTILKGLVCFFLLLDAVMKLIKSSPSVEGTKQLGLPENCVQFLGIYLLISAVLYIYPRTVVTGFLFLFAYLGAAVAITYRANVGGHSYIFPIAFAVFILLAEFLRNATVRNIIPLI
ncbi:MAG: hypothetical protein JWQ66_1162 [Mucilaginibacter sp.]|jgi:hypothetical protein|nr:hypothetical protein [Mucilaginibacter sp.]